MIGDVPWPGRGKRGLGTATDEEAAAAEVVAVATPCDDSEGPDGANGSVTGVGGEAAAENSEKTAGSAAGQAVPCGVRASQHCIAAESKKLQTKTLAPGDPSGTANSLKGVRASGASKRHTTGGGCHDSAVVARGGKGDAAYSAMRAQPPLDAAPQAEEPCGTVFSGVAGVGAAAGAANALAPRDGFVVGVAAGVAVPRPGLLELCALAPPAPS